jgi:uncharacterized protein (DUF1697 family)
MTQYVAFPRGINAGHRMSMAELRAVFDSLGYEHVRTVLASGNVLFQTGRKSEALLIREIERGLASAFGAKIAVVLRTRRELERLAAAQPFAQVDTRPTTRLFVTFLKKKPAGRRGSPTGEGFEILGIVGRDVCSVLDLAQARSPDFMRVLDREFGKEVTTRGWPTVERILKAFES